MSISPEYEKMYVSAIFFAVIILLINILTFSYPLFERMDLDFAPLVQVLWMFSSGGLLSSPFPSKMVVLLLSLLCCIVRHGKGGDVSVPSVITILLAGGVSYFYHFRNPLFYMLGTVSGICLLVWGFILVSRLFSSYEIHDNDLKESFMQQNERIDCDPGIVLPMTYRFKKKDRKGFINVTNPFRGTLVVGSAGSGKSYSVFVPYICQMLRKGYTMMVYDFKMPDLSKIVYNESRMLDESIRPSFYCINFQDPVRSNRCNPLSKEYLSDVVDASETAKVVMDALYKGQNRGDFFQMSAQQYFAVCLWFLRTYTPVGGKEGDWCDFPHLIEFINYDYTKVLSLVKREPALDGKARMFIDALEAKAQDQLQGQIASVRLPLNDLSSPILYWVFSGNDFSLDLNDPLSPKVVCIGNDPDRQQVYGAAISLLTFRIIKRINKDGRLPCGIILDELPTIVVNGLDTLMSTARSRKVAVVLGVQDISQINADYGEVVAKKIIALPSNVFVGSSSVDTAARYSKEFGREFRLQKSMSVNDCGQTVSFSSAQEDIIPIRKITSLERGTFIGKVAVDDSVIVEGKRVKVDLENPFFCCRIDVDVKEREKKESSYCDLPVVNDFGIDGISDGPLTDWQKKMVDEAMMRNFNKIRQDIVDLFESFS